MQDRLSNVSGDWKFLECPGCGPVWLYPMPDEDDIWRLYKNYYTHPDRVNNQRGLLLRFLKRLYKLLLKITLIYWQRKRLSRMYLGKGASRKLLEVGCGSGVRLIKMKKMGWMVHGQEIDPRAEAIAKASDCDFKIFLGPLETLKLSDSTYNAIIMNHVIEHAIDPIKLLMECRRILKDEGVLVMVTPNVESYGHRRFRQNWQHLDPPRHQHIFSTKTLTALAKKAGFENVNIWTTTANAESLAYASYKIEYGNKYDNIHKGLKSALSLRAFTFQLFESIIHLSKKESGEEAVMRAVKKS